MSLKTARLHLRLFLEGIEVPVVSAQVAGAINQTAVCTLQLVPTPMAHQILNRTKVDLFFHDLYAHSEAARSRVAYGSTSSVEGATSQQRFSPMVPERPEDGEIRRQTQDGDNSTIGGETADTLQIPQDLINYRLLFTGEVIGFTYVKEAATRGIVLQCAGNSSYWDMVAADKRGGMLFGGDRRTAFQGLTQSPFWDLLNGATGEVFEKLTQPPVMFPNLTGFTAGLMHIMEGIFGVYTRKTREGSIVVGGANQFMSMAALRLKLLQQIGVTGGDDCPIRLMRRRGFGSIWRPALRGLPRYFGFRHMLAALMPYTFYEHTPIIAPHYTPPTGFYANMANWSGYTTGFLRNSPEWSWISRTADTIEQLADGVLSTDIAEIEEQISSGSGVNVTEYADLLSNLRGRAQYIRRYANTIYGGVTSERTRVDEVIQQLESAPSEEESPSQGITHDEIPSEDASGDSLSTREEQVAGTSFSCPPRPNPFPEIRSETRRSRDVLRRLEPVAARAQSIETNAQKLLSALDRTTLPGQTDEKVKTLLTQIIADARFISGFAMSPPNRGDSDAADSEPAHLYCDILRPDVWFCAPPRANVIFPDHYTRLQFGRVFHQEATRLLVKMHDRILGSDPFFDKWWIAPISTGVFRDQQVARSGEARTRIKRDLMDHELYGGIIPMFQSMSDRDMFLGARVAGFGGHPSEISNDQRRYFQSVCNFLLFRTRFSARTLQVDTRFNPYAILGFPSVILDSPTDARQTEVNQNMLNIATEALSGVGESPSAVILELIKKRTGVHYLGTIVQMTHTISANAESSGTSMLLSYARSHNEKIEMLGQDVIRLAQETTRRQEDRVAHRRSAEVDHVLREIQVWQERLNAYTRTGMRDDPYSDGLINPQEGDPTALEIPTVGGNTTLTGTYQQVAERLADLRSSLEQMPEEVRRVQIEVPSRRTSSVFALDPPIPRRGTPPDSSGEGASDDYARGQIGPFGGEIVEVEEVTDQHRNTSRARNVSGLSAEETARYRSALAGERGLDHRLEQDRDRLDQEYSSLTPEEISSGDPMVRTSDDSAQRSEDTATVNSLGMQTENLRGLVNDYDRGWRTEYVSLPFISTARDGRNRPITVITTDKIGIEFDARELPELMSIIGDPSGQAATVILKVYRITEDMSEQSGEILDLGAEDVLRPPWYSNYWNNSLIGGAVYLPYFGTGSIVDPVAVMTPESLDLFMDPSRSSATMSQVRTDIQYEETGNGTSPVVAGLLEGSTIENAVDWLAHTYSLTRIANYDVDSFIYNYTWRPIATIFDMFGSGDLRLDEEGERVVSGVEGFHSRAFGPWSNLFGLMSFTDITKFLGIDASDVAGASRVDVRARRYAIIQAYRIELLNSRGCAL